MGSFRERILAHRTQQLPILVVGLGASGIESALALRRIGVPVRAVERMAAQEFQARSKFAARLEEVEKAGVETAFGIDGERVGGFCERVTLAIISPGVAREGAICGALLRRKVDLIGELELGVELTAGRSVVVTGSNGKSTTSTLIASLLKRGGIPSRLCGNIGVPVVASLDARHLESSSNALETLVVEASSYQLEFCTVLKPKVAVFLNLSDNHLERHGSMERYFAIKANLFTHQEREDFAVINADDDYGRRLLGAVRGTAVPFGVNKEILVRHAPSGWYGHIAFDAGRGLDSITLTTPQGVEEYEVSHTRLLGLHNRYDMAAALLAARLSGVVPETARQVLADFSPLEHRLEFVLGYPAGGDQPIVINDSKATTVAASLAAFRTVRDFLPGRRILLMLGGLAKAGSWDPLMRELSRIPERLAPVVCFGDDGELIANHCTAAGIAVRTSPTLAQATEMALAAVGSGEVVLLAPGCASFDEFTDFEHRGSVFKSLVKSSTHYQHHAAQPLAV